MPFFKLTTTLFDNQLEQLAGKVVAGAEALHLMIRQPENAQAIARQIGDLENAADRILRDTVAIQTTSLASAERGDLLDLLEKVDDIIDVAHAASERLWLH